MEVRLTDVGATITAIIVPDRDGNPVDVALGYESIKTYTKNLSSHGTIVGRVANRIGGASLSIDGVIYNLEANHAPHTLHSGTDRYAYREWTVEKANSESATFSLISPDGDQGYPGTATITVTYAIDDNNGLSIKYDAVSDKTTVFNLTNHCYFNLNGHNAGLICDHRVCIDADKYTETDADSVPTGNIVSVEGTPMDFRKPKIVGDDIDADFQTLREAGGFDHNYVLNNPSIDHVSARVESPSKGIYMEVYTDMPGVQFYTGNFLGKDIECKGGMNYVRRAALCLETQYFPDSPHHDNFPSIVFGAGEHMTSETVYRFGTF